jgi:hypothetical protein
MTDTIDNEPPMSPEERDTHLVALVAGYHALLVGLRLEAGKLADDLTSCTIIATGEALEHLSKPTELELRVGQDIELVKEAGGPL